MKKLSKSGFTFVEIVLVTTILAVVGLAIYGTFANGINIWRRVTQETTNEDINLFFERISYDLRNSFKLHGIRFHGENTKVSFPNKIKFSDKGEIKKSIGKITYSFDRRRKTLEKREASYSDVYHKRDGEKRVLVEGISSLKFEYFIYDADTKKYLWVRRWQDQDDPFGEVKEENLPLIVKIEVGVPENGGEKKFVKTVSIPSACCWPFEKSVR